MRRALAKLIPDARAEAVLKSNRTAGAGKAGAQLANAVLGHLPLGVAVIDAGARLLFWNEQAAGLFGLPPLMAAQMPLLKEVLAGIANLTPRQRDAIVAFVATDVAAGDRVEPESYLRISPGRRSRLVIQVRGIGSGRWMVVIDDGKLAVASARSGPPQDGGVAWTDALTGLSNRRHFNEVLRRLVEDASPEPGHSVLLIDLDRFTAINETLGHPVGDALLCLVARRLRREAREDDLLVRLGGDEFVILITNGDRAERLAARLVEVLSHPFLVEGHIANISACVGIARCAVQGTSADDLMRYAELALYDAKSAGRRTWRLFDPAEARGCTDILGYPLSQPIQSAEVDAL